MDRSYLWTCTRRQFIGACAAGAAGAALGPAIVQAGNESACTPMPAHLKPVADAFEKDPRATALAWFRAAKFGLFIHYGLFSLDGIHPFEQFQRKIPVKDYEKKTLRFTAEKFDAGTLCDLALDAGMKYVTLVTKHCDGFCLWDTKQTPFNSVNSAARPDLVGEMVHACNARGLGFFALEVGRRLRDHGWPKA